ncbi:hypothetical protein J2Z49_001922 [Desulfofundulus luciae]|uniref:Nudix hydrolase domain-containing protein n=1 Tax=Desulfofundulus luciae TaxID=74702 RepID=A0ABU0B255_9FIRM|nr:hypothetical protein [Desulfofundulus luciae]
MYSPVPEFATHFGVGIMVVTADGKIIFCERGPTAVDAFVFFPSVAEGSSRPVDAGPNGGPDPYRTAVRGLAEELDLEISPDHVKSLSFGANAVLCEYALCGVVYVEQTEEEILSPRRLQYTAPAPLLSLRELRHLQKLLLFFPGLRVGELRLLPGWPARWSWDLPREQGSSKSPRPDQREAQCLV